MSGDLLLSLTFSSTFGGLSAEAWSLGGRVPAILCDRGRLVCWDAWSKEGICVRTLWWLRYHFLDLPLEDVSHHKDYYYTI